MFNFFPLFGLLGKRVTQVVLLLGLVYGVYRLWDWLWHEPERWNHTAEVYRTHEKQLIVDSTYQSHTISHQDSIISLLNARHQKAMVLLDRWQCKYDSTLTESDRRISRMSKQEQQLAYYKALVANHTLAPSPVPYTPDNPAVIEAGLKTAEREVIAKRTLDSLSSASSEQTSDVDRMRNGYKSIAQAARNMAAAAKQKAKGGVWPINVPKKKQARAFAKSADSLANAAEQISELEIEVNQKKP